MKLRPDVVKNSAMRFSLTIVSIGVFIILLALTAHIIMNTLGGGLIKWSEIGLFVAGLAALLTGSGWNKANQKKTEVNNENQKE